MEKFTPDILKGLELRHMKFDGNMYYNDVMGLIKHKLPEKFTPHKYINIQPKLDRVDIQNKYFVYMKQIINGLYIMKAVKIIHGKYKKDIVLKLGVSGVRIPMVCIVQTDEFDYEFVIAPMDGEKLDNNEIFDIEQNETSIKNYKQETFEI